ncbi:MAG: DUF5302 domain-containing protein [Actinomycetia bacterium]|nr:DUF5302 domain-containing protein [Actinomycetes bacterium]
MTDQPTPQDDIKAKFREALNKKHEHQHATAEGAEHDGSDKAHGTADRTEAPIFRRKSAGGGA